VRAVLAELADQLDALRDRDAAITADGVDLYLSLPEDPDRPSVDISVEGQSALIRITI
jgi:hypothetical protein